MIDNTFDLRNVLPDDPGYQAILEKKTLTIENKERSYWMFIGKPYIVANPVIFVFAPNGVDVKTFAEQSGWLEVSRNHGFVVVFPEHENGVWDLNGETDLVFWDKLRDIKDIRYQPHNTRQYISGYGEGAAMAELAVLQTPEFFAGAALVDPIELGANVLTKAGLQIAPEYKKYIDVLGNRPPILVKDAEQNILVYTPNPDQLKETLTFWRATGAEVGKGSRVLVKQIETPISCLPAEIFETFFNKTRRYRVAPNGRLREASDYRDNPNAKRCYENMAGQLREWVEVIPSDYDASKSYPLILMLHGSNNDGPQMYDISRLWEVAEERKFIVLFPTSLRGKNTYNAWNLYRNKPEDNGNPDPEFLLELIERYKKEYSVDSSRIYISGFSNGGGMTNYMAMNYPEIFAAAMPYSGAMKNDDYLPEIKEKRSYMPIWVNKGSLEYKPESLSVVNHLKSHWEFWAKWNEADLKKCVTVDEEKLNTQVYQGKAECRYSVRKDAHHAITTEDYWSIYDEFFARFQRGADGSSIESNYSHICRLNEKYGKLSHSKRIDGDIYVCVREAEAVFGKLPKEMLKLTREIDNEQYCPLNK